MTAKKTKTPTKADKNEAEATKAHVAANDNGEDSAKRLADEAEQAEKARASLKERTNDIKKSDLKDYGYKETENGVDADTTWLRFFKDRDDEKPVYARRIDAPFKVGKNEEDDGYLVVDAKGNPSAVSKVDFEADGAYVAV